MYNDIKFVSEVNHQAILWSCQLQHNHSRGKLESISRENINKRLANYIWQHNVANEVFGSFLKEYL